MEKIEEKLQIILVTYNRLKKLQETMEQILGKKSPIQNCSITILDNKSTDGTSEFIEELCRVHKNLTHVVNNRNIGGNANIAKAFEIASMQYIWILCDDDKYDFTYWHEIEEALLSDKYDCILTERKVDFSEKDLPYIINTLAFVSSGIYKTKNITTTVMMNIESNIMYSFPHLMLGVHLLNVNAEFFVPKHSIINQNENYDFTRGTQIEELHFRQRHTNLFSGYINSYQMIIDKKLRKECINVLYLGKSFFYSMKTFVKLNRTFPLNACDLFYGCVGLWQRIQFIFAIICVFFIFIFRIPKKLISRRKKIEYYPKSNAEQLHIIWDLDGTLINSEQEVLASLIRAVQLVGFSESDQKEPFRVGPTIDKMLDNAFSSNILTPQKKSEIISSFREIYDNCGFNKTPAFEGIEEILSDSRFVHHIVTNKPDLATNRILEKLGWKNYFASVITPYSFMKSTSDKKKTKTELFAICMRDYPDKKFVGIGDMDTDIRAATNNNISAIGVLWGTGTKNELKKCTCTHIVKTVGDLKNTLERIGEKYCI